MKSIDFKYVEETRTVWLCTRTQCIILFDNVKNVPTYHINMYMFNLGDGRLVKIMIRDNTHCDIKIYSADVYNHIIALRYDTTNDKFDVGLIKFMTNKYTLSWYNFGRLQLTENYYNTIFDTNTLDTILPLTGFNINESNGKIIINVEHQNVDKQLSTVCCTFAADGKAVNVTID